SFFFSIDVASPYPHSFPTRRSSDLKNPKLSDRWHITYRNAEVAIKLRLGLTSFKHVGVFPEQAVNWDYISGVIKAFRTPRPKVLNLFAYTGGASLIARAAGADTTHVDSI